MMSDEKYSFGYVYRFASDGSVDETPLRGREDIIDGTELAVLGFLGYHYHQMTVKHSEGRFTASNDHLSAILQFDTDDRHCWITTGFINTRAIRSGLIEWPSGEATVTREPSCTACHDQMARKLRIQLDEVTVERDQAETKLHVAEHNNQILRDAKMCLQSEINSAFAEAGGEDLTRNITSVTTAIRKLKSDRDQLRIDAETQAAEDQCTAEFAASELSSARAERDRLRDAIERLTDIPVTTIE